MFHWRTGQWVDCLYMAHLLLTVACEAVAMLYHEHINQSKVLADITSIKQSGMKNTGVCQQHAVHGSTVLCISNKQGKRYSMFWLTFG